jgi:hypothetical protein
MFSLQATDTELSTVLAQSNPDQVVTRIRTGVKTWSEYIVSKMDTGITTETLVQAFPLNVFPRIAGCDQV